MELKHVYVGHDRNVGGLTLKKNTPCTHLGKVTSGGHNIVRIRIENGDTWLVPKAQVEFRA
jgi:hypothetical protein